jgi:hypothetical protein
VVARHVALVLSAFDVMTLAHGRGAVKHFVAWAIWAVNLALDQLAQAWGHAWVMMGHLMGSQILTENQ